MGSSYMLYPRLLQHFRNAQDEIAAKHGVMHCKRPGCETKWVSLTPSEDQHGFTHEFSIVMAKFGSELRFEPERSRTER
jgi:hypothetical protein